MSRRASTAGLTAAEYLRVAGYEVHVYDRHDRAGGLLTYGIPGFKLEKHVIMRRVQRLKDGGIQFHESFEVGKDATLEQLRDRHDALLIATGVYQQELWRSCPRFRQRPVQRQGQECRRDRRW